MTVLKVLASLVKEQREQNIQRIAGLLSTIKPSSWDNGALVLDRKLTHALLYHSLYELKEAAKIADEARALAVLSLWNRPAQTQRNLVQTICGDLFIQDSQDSCLARNIDSENEVWVLSGDTMDLEAKPKISLVQRAVAIAEDVGCGYYLDAALAIVILMKQRELDEPTNSWSVSSLPGTIYMDYQIHPALVAKDLIHESAHCWLNECLDACRESLPSKEAFYSPWKRKMRPAYGIIHAGFAFSCVHNFLTALLGTDIEIPHDVHTACERHLEKETHNLCQARATIESALELLQTQHIRQMVAQEMFKACYH